MRIKAIISNHNWPLACILLFIVSVFMASCNRNDSSSSDTQVAVETESPLGNEEVAEATLFAPGIVSGEESVEFGISFSPDLRNVYFTSKGPEEEVYAIYTSTFQNGAWTKAVVAPFSGKYFDADAFVSLDGSKIYFFSLRPIAPDTNVLSAPNIWWVEKEGEQWSEARYLGEPINSPETGEGFLSLTQEDVMYFSSFGRADSTAKHDIHRAYLKDGNYTEPEHLSIDISIQYSNPYISADEKFLIVDSPHPEGYGQSDLYISYLEDGNWSKPENLGPLVNTGGHEGTPYISPDKKFLFFSRDGDIYYISTSALKALNL